MNTHILIIVEVLFIYFTNVCNAQQCGLSCPFFTAPSYSGSVTENATINTQVLAVSASNLNADSMVYGITYIGQDFPFDIGPTTGIIVVSGTLNFQVQARYDFTVTATMYLGFNKVVSCTIYVTDVLDPVVCQSSPFLAGISENMQPGNISQCMNCNSPEQPNEVINYITSSLLSIDSNGLIWLNETLDYENETMHDVSVSFTDSNGNKLEGLSIITVVVLPINEYSPVFDQSDYDFSVKEGNDIGCLIGLVTATDDDDGPDGELQYAIVNASEYFHIFSDTGEIYSSIVFDYEDQTQYSFSITVSDRPQDMTTVLVDSAVVTVQIIDINDNPPKFTENPYIVTVLENLVPFSVAFSIHCTDADSEDNKIIEYHILDNQTDLFSVNESTGDVTLLSELDFENERYHQFNIECIDQSFEKFSSKALVIVEVLEVNEHTPYFLNSMLSISLQEDLLVGSTLATFEAQDNDSGFGGELSYSIIHTDICPLNIDITSDTGIVFLSGKLDSSYPETLECTVIVQDNLPPFKTAEGTLELSIIAGNYNLPYCQPSFVVTSISEDSAIGSVITVLNCLDKDNDYLYYSILSGGEQFSIYQDTNLVVALELDYESQTSHIITIVVSDGKHSTTLTVLLIINPANEYKPVFDDSMLTCFVIESVIKGQEVCNVLASDEDKDSDGIITYSLSIEQDLFSIDPDTGYIYLIGQLDYEGISEYHVTVYASDNNDIDVQFTSSAVLSIQIMDTNDNYPTMVSYLYAEVYENSTMGTVMTIINCTDIDSLENGVTTLDIVSVVAHTHETDITDITEENPFSLNSQNGVMEVTGTLDYEHIPFYEITIVCEDNGQPEKLSSTSTMLLTVLNVNEHSPYFNTSIVYTYTSVNDKPGTELVTLVAMDNDRNDKLAYTMSLVQPKTTLSPLFLQLESSTGAITVASMVHCIDSFEFLFNVTVSDSGGLTGYSQLLVTLEECLNVPLITKSDTFTATVEENDDPNITIGTIECNAPNQLDLPSGSVIHYSLENSENEFSINQTTGDLYSLISLDYEQQQLYVLQSTCYYSHRPDIFRSINIYVNVLPVNEYSPTFETNELFVNISEDSLPGTIIATMEATDLDLGQDGRVFYSIENGSNELEFVIDSNSSTVYLVDQIDRENKDEYTLTIVAIDNAMNVSNRKTSLTLMLKILVTDINDNYPTCSNMIYYSTLLSSTPPDTIVTTIECNDLDLDENSTLIFSTDGNNDYSLKLIVNETTGLVYLKEPINNTSTLYHTIPIIVSDSGLVPFTVIVYISVLLEFEQILDQSRKIISETEGWKNNVTAIIDNMDIEQWSQATMTVFQEVIARMTATHCALYPLSCSLLTACSNVTMSFESECSNYVQFPIESVVFHHSVTEGITDGTTSLHVYVYVVLPEGIARSPFRMTEYVIPQNTLEIIVSENVKTINAVVRDAVHIATHSLDNAWKQLAISLLVIMLVFVASIIIAVIVTKVHKELEKIKERNKIYPAGMVRRVSTARTLPSICASTIYSTPPSTSNGKHRQSPDSCSLIAISEEGSSTVGHTSTSTESGQVRNPPSHWSRYSIIRRLMLFSAKHNRSQSSTSNEMNELT